MYASQRKQQSLSFADSATQEQQMVLAYEKTLVTALRLVESNKQANV